jgi:hypothetical protein
MAQHTLCRQTPEVGAECPNWARSDLCGGRSAMSVPTATVASLLAMTMGTAYGGGTFVIGLRCASAATVDVPIAPSSS